MKKMVFLFSLLLCFQLAFTQKNKYIPIPQDVKDRFLFTFPQAGDSVGHPVNWEMVKSNYKGTLTVMNAPASAVIDPTGRLIRVEMVIHEAYVPEKAKTYLKNTYKDATIKSYMKLTDEKGKTSFRANLELKPVFDEQGNLMKLEN